MTCLQARFAQLVNSGRFPGPQHIMQRARIGSQAALCTSVIYTANDFFLFINLMKFCAKETFT